jgi:hypothetical protein
VSRKRRESCRSSGRNGLPSVFHGHSQQPTFANQGSERTSTRISVSVLCAYTDVLTQFAFIEFIGRDVDFDHGVKTEVMKLAGAVGTTDRNPMRARVSYAGRLRRSGPVRLNLSSLPGQPCRYSS